MAQQDRAAASAVRVRDDLDEARARELLAAERTRIERELGELAEPGADAELAHGDQHLADEASDLYEDEFRAGRVDDLREELRAVERAEQRLASGTFGLSVESGLPIPDERLEAYPTAERTVEEERRAHGRASG
jgi:RNA polymerase-binding transcription factor